MDVIKAVAVQQPEITRLATHEVSIDVKTWTTAHRGPILLVSATTPRIEPAGYAIAVARLVDCRSMVKEDEPRAGKTPYPGARAWVYEDVEPLKIFPVDVRPDVFEVVVPPFGLRTVAKVALVPESYRRSQMRRAATPAPRPPQTHRLDVLVVDAYAPVGRGIQRLLAPEHDVRLATSVEAAVEEIQRRAPDAVICDCALGHEGSLKLLTWLEQSCPRARRILYTAARSQTWSDLIDRRLVHQALTKPASEQELRRAVAA